MMRVLVADDSALARETLTGLINDDPEMTVVDVACNGLETVRKAERTKPNLITMDLVMPDIDGVEATRRIMSQHPVPIVLVSSTVTSVFSPTHFDALAVGAVDVVEKPDFRLLRADVQMRRRFLENLKTMSNVVTVTRRALRDDRSTIPPPLREPTRTLARLAPENFIPNTAKLIVIGASTGGPPALAQVLAELDATSCPPVVVVQHMASGFIEGFADWLGQRIRPRVELALTGVKLQPGTVYVAPDERHVEVTSYARLLVHQAPPVRYHRPSVDVLFQSAATNLGRDVVGVLMTGMGDDGARGLSAIRGEGGFTIAQDKQSCLVYGMPAAAFERGAVCWSGDCEAIMGALGAIRNVRSPSGGAV